MGLSEERVRVFWPGVGGGFGAKLQHYAEELACAFAARKLGHPVKYIETRSEHMMCTHHGRDQIDYVRMAGSRDGTITAIHAKVIADLGAYHHLLTPFIPSFTAFVLGGCYKIPNVQTDVVGVFTNKMSTDAIRGAGRPEATPLLEVMVDQFAAEIGMDPLEVRRKNFIGKDEFPAEVAVGIVYDSGDYHGTLEKLLANFDLEAFRREQEEARAAGRRLGVGFSTYME